MLKSKPGEMKIQGGTLTFFDSSGRRVGAAERLDEVE
jgi:hypothetical protein